MVSYGGVVWCRMVVRHGVVWWCSVVSYGGEAWCRMVV